MSDPSRAANKPVILTGTVRSMGGEGSTRSLEQAGFLAGPRVCVGARQKDSRPMNDYPQDVN